MRIFFAFLLVAFFTPFASAEQGLKSLQSNCSTALACSLNSVVSVLPIWPPTVKRSEEPEGSGIVIGDGQIIASANHVIGPAKKVLVRTAMGEVIAAKIVMRDRDSDIALLTIDRQLPAFKIAETYGIGDRACAIGNAFGLSLSLSCGVVSATQLSGTGFNLIEDFVQTDAAVNPGMSGGALVNANGELIGMLSAIFTKQTDANIGVNFAVSSQLLLKLYNNHLGAKERIVSGLKIGPSLRPGEVGVIGAKIFAIEAGSAEAKAGLQKGDVILTVNSRRLKRAGAYIAALSLIDRGHTALIEILRAGEPMSLSVKY